MKRAAKDGTSVILVVARRLKIDMRAALQNRQWVGDGDGLRTIIAMMSVVYRVISAADRHGPGVGSRVPAEDLSMPTSPIRLPKAHHAAPTTSHDMDEEDQTHSPQRLAANPHRGFLDDAGQLVQRVGVQAGSEAAAPVDEREEVGYILSQM